MTLLVGSDTMHCCPVMSCFKLCHKLQQFDHPQRMLIMIFIIVTSVSVNSKVSRVVVVLSTLLTSDKSDTPFLLMRWLNVTLLNTELLSEPLTR